MCNAPAQNLATSCVTKLMPADLSAAYKTKAKTTDAQEQTWTFKPVNRETMKYKRTLRLQQIPEQQRSPAIITRGF